VHISGCRPSEADTQRVPGPVSGTEPPSYGYACGAASDGAAELPMRAAELRRPSVERSEWGMDAIRRLSVWGACALLVVGADSITKAAPHRMVAANHMHTPFVVYAVVGCFLVGLGVSRSPFLVAGAGLMFGALCGNAGQLLMVGYATDWIPIGGWLTNVADIAGAVGLLMCFAGYARSLAGSRPVRESERKE
jgi:hypothetical protein